MSNTVNVTISSAGPMANEEIRRAVQQALAAAQDRTERALDAAESEWTFASLAAIREMVEAVTEGRMRDAAAESFDAIRCAACARMVRPVFALCAWFDRMARS